MKNFFSRTSNVARSAMAWRWVHRGHVVEIDPRRIWVSDVPRLPLLLAGTPNCTQANINFRFWLICGEDGPRVHNRRPNSRIAVPWLLSRRWATIDPALTKKYSDFYFYQILFPLKKTYYWLHYNYICHYHFSCIALTIKYERSLGEL